MILITGASTGIGYELSYLYAHENKELLMISSNIKKLEDAKQRILKDFPNAKINIFECDMSKIESANIIYKHIKEKKYSINTLINNAGFGYFGEFINTDLKKEQDMMILNNYTLVSLTKYVLADMKEGSSIVNICSVASFTPGPLMSIYYASKSFVLSFSLSLREELISKKINVIAVCPGATATNFEKKANLNGQSKLFMYFKPMSAKKVAILTKKAIIKNKNFIVTGYINKIMVFMTRLTPYFILAKFTKKLQEKTKIK